MLHVQQQHQQTSRVRLVSMLLLYTLAVMPESAHPACNWHLYGQIHNGTLATKTSDQDAGGRQGGDSSVQAAAVSVPDIQSKLVAFVNNTLPTSTSTDQPPMETGARGERLSWQMHCAFLRLPMHRESMNCIRCQMT